MDRTGVAADPIAPQTEPSAAAPAEAKLTPREVQCLEALAHGRGNADIAADLGISLATVAMHLANARRKLKALSREHAVALAVKLRLVSF
jgi:DNA-binding CsgD family transcriptional regulator